MVYINLITSLALVTLSAEFLVSSSKKIADHFRVSSRTFGMIIVGPATSLPEIAVSIEALSQGYPDIVMGNALGSTIANIGLVLAISLYFIKIQPSDQKEIYRQLLDVVVIGAVLCYGVIRWYTSTALCIFYLWRLFSSRQQTQTQTEPHESSSPIHWYMLLLAISILTLFYASDLLITSCKTLGEIWHISDLVIGLSIVAIGTSLPELATGLSCIRQNNHDLAIGNIFGSNTICLLVITSMAGFQGSYQVLPINLYRDIPIILLLNGLVFLLSKNQKHLTQLVIPIIMLSTFVGYQVSLFV